MRVDEGDIRGGFSRSYDAWIDDGDVTPIKRSIAEVVGMRIFDTVTVEVICKNGDTWKRGFSGSFDGSAPCVFTTPHPDVLGVRIRGVCFVVDVACPDEPVQLDVWGHLVTSASDVDGGRMFLADDLAIHAFDGVRVLWTSDRVSLDGISDLLYADGYVHGTATDVGVHAVRFSIDAETGRVVRIDGLPPRDSDDAYKP